MEPCNESADRPAKECESDSPIVRGVKEPFERICDIVCLDSAYIPHGGPEDIKSAEGKELNNSRIVTDIHINFKFRNGSVQNINEEFPGANGYRLRVIGSIKRNVVVGWGPRYR